ncbi:sulfite exporter TauE/SafE family protein [Thermodesulfobacterium sp. TA1]|uniref:sulfite exporter TauE/SafE family protein n=1 Tax=Thermodesulfobacterium sp. TA1 TaxID=2234087 RepID=UPI001231D1AF|nr:sulfite exporter TauE/SafE family protein [Thermodesulfobacterium sp. TA1]QER41289.1 sulfite exporter TauE/SafE family protein [Thermodesulfobacterium sp. TA1]
MESIIIIIGIFILAFVSGMIGLGVAFSAIPFLGLFMDDLVHQVQPLSLLLNGVTALLSALGFAKSGFIEWKKAIYLSIITTLSAPVGAVLAHYISQDIIWVIYFFSVLYLAYRLFKPIKAVKEDKTNFKLAAILAVPISVLSGLLGVGPGFLLMPTLIICGFDPKRAAGINAFAVCPPSFSALLPHISTAHWNFTLTIALITVGAVASYLGARATSLYVPSKRIKQIFATLIVIVTAYKITTLFFK